MTNEVENLKESVRVTLSYRSAMKLYQELSVLTNALANGGCHTMGEVALAVTLLAANTAAIARTEHESSSEWLKTITSLLEAEYGEALKRLAKEHH